MKNLFRKEKGLFNRGFTLTEIMIVVVIVALLASLAVPSLKRARLNAHASQYLADRKVIANAIEHYRAETGLDITNDTSKIIPENLYKYLPEKFRTEKPDAPFGGKWYVFKGGSIINGITDDTTSHIGLDSPKLATTQEIIDILTIMGRLDSNTFVPTSNTIVLIYTL